jgi:hypothetical protein
MQERQEVAMEQTAGMDGEAEKPDGVAEAGLVTKESGGCVMCGACGIVGHCVLETECSA